MSELSRLTEVVLLGCRTRRNRSRSPTQLEPTFSPLDEVGLRLGCTCGGWLRGLLLWDGNVGASGKDLVRAAHAPGGVDLGVRFCDSLGGGTGMGMRVGNRPDGVARASCLYTNRRPVRGKGKSEHVPDSLRDPRSGSGTANLHRMILARGNFLIFPFGNFH